MKSVLLFCLVLSQTGFAITLDEYLAQVKKKNRIYSAIDLSVEASNERREAGDLLLTPQLTASYALINDKTVPSTLAEQRKTSEYNLGLSKRFSTGTFIGLTAKTDQYNNEGPPLASPVEYSTGGLGITLQQSLWKDFFGQGTRLRNQREYAVNQAETLSLDLRRRGILLEAETSFWDYVVATEDVKLKQENLDRARKLDRWTSNRVNNGISDRADLMNVKALSSVRELELQTTLDELKTQEVRFRENLDLTVNEPTPALSSNLVEARPYINELMQKKNVIKIESYLASLDAQAKKFVSLEVAESLKPDLTLVGAYNTSSYDPEYNKAVKDISKTDHPRTYVGLNLTWLFDTEAKRSQIAASQKDAWASQYNAEKLKTQGQTAWTELLRKYQTTQETVKTLEKIANYQRERAKAEQDKFAKGRTITLNVVTAETDSAEASVRYLRAKSGLRKLEATTLLFTSIQE